MLQIVLINVISLTAFARMKGSNFQFCQNDWSVFFFGN